MGAKIAGMRVAARGWARMGKCVDALMRPLTLVVRDGNEAV